MNTRGEDTHWTTWVPETREDVDFGAECLNGSAMAGRVPARYFVKMGLLYTLRCDMKQLASWSNEKSFEEIFRAI